MRCCGRARTSAIHRSRGSTASEQLLADLGEQAFLNLWSYPNLFYDKKQNGKGDGKELCDMLVVCGDDVIIFSDNFAHRLVEWIRAPLALRLGDHKYPPVISWR